MDRNKNDTFMKTGVQLIMDEMREDHLNWFGHIPRWPTKELMTSSQDELVNTKGKDRGRSKNTWSEKIKRDMLPLKLWLTLLLGNIFERREWLPSNSWQWLLFCSFVVTCALPSRIWITLRSFSWDLPHKIYKSQ